MVRDVLNLQSHRAHFMDYDFIAVGDNRNRKCEAERAENNPPPPIIHPSATVALGTIILNGTIIMAGAVVQPGARIGRHCIINTSSTVDHDCVIEDYVHIAPGANLCGNVHVGEGSLIGVGVGIPPNTTIPPWTIVKANTLRMKALR